jgi:hypothetical protein
MYMRRLVSKPSITNHQLQPRKGLWEVVPLVPGGVMWELPTWSQRAVSWIQTSVYCCSYGKLYRLYRGEWCGNFPHEVNEPCPGYRHLSIVAHVGCSHRVIRVWCPEMNPGEWMAELSHQWISAFESSLWRGTKWQRMRQESPGSTHSIESGFQNRKSIKYWFVFFPA